MGLHRARAAAAGDLLQAQELFPSDLHIADRVPRVLRIEAEHRVMDVFAVVDEIAAAAVLRGIRLQATRYLVGIVALDAEGRVAAGVAAKRVFRVPWPE